MLYTAEPAMERPGALSSYAPGNVADWPDNDSVPEPVIVTLQRVKWQVNQ